jgi:hypothetical protein
MFSKHHLLFKNIKNKKDPCNNLLMVDLGTSSSLEFVNSWKNDYNMDTNLPFVY